MAVRRTASLLVVLIGWLYLVPQLQGAGLTLATQTGAPPGWAGGLVVCVVVLTAVAVGRHALDHLRPGVPVLGSKFVALLVPAVVLLVVWQHRDDQRRERLSSGMRRRPS